MLGRSESDTADTLRRFNTQRQSKHAVQLKKDHLFLEKLQLHRPEVLCKSSVRYRGSLEVWSIGC